MKQDNNKPSKIPLTDISPEAEKILQSLDPEKRRVMVQSLLEMKREMFSGPIPHPDILRGYEDVQQGFAERIMSMAEREQTHRIDIEQRMVGGSLSQTCRGQWMGLAVAVLFLCVAGVLGWLGHDWLAGTLGGGTIVALVTVFVKNRPTDRQ